MAVHSEEPSETNRFDTKKTTEVYKNGKVVAVSSIMRGFRRKQEDRCCVQLNMRNPGQSDSNHTAYLAVFDGHRGSAMAQHAMTVLHKRLVESPSYIRGNVSQALIDTFIAMDDDVRAGKVVSFENEEEDKNYPQEAGDPTISGCTATVALWIGDRIWVANAGDSRAVLSRGGVARALSQDHTPYAPRELERIHAAGAQVIRGKVGMLLNMSRSLGDIHTKYIEELPPEKQAITCVPEVTETVVDPEDEFLVLVSDGVWNALRNKEQLARDGLQSLEGSQELTTRLRLPEGASKADITAAIAGLSRERVGSEIVKLSDEQSYELYLEGEKVSNQNLVDTVRWCIGKRLPLEMICECVLDFCLENYNGNDNTAIIIVPVLGGRTMDQWYKWVAKRVKKGVGRALPAIFEAYEPRDGGSLTLNEIVANGPQK